MLKGLSTDAKVTLAFVLVAAAGAFVVYRSIRAVIANPGGTGQAIGETAAGVVGGVAKGVIGLGEGAVLGAGDILGVTRTEMTQCEADLAAGRKWDASFSCPASTFLKHVFD